MVDEATGKRVALIARVAAVAGTNLAEGLDQVGLLNTGDRRNETVRRALDVLIDQMESLPAHVFQRLGGGQPTVADGVRGIIEFTKIYRKAFD